MAHIRAFTFISTSLIWSLNFKKEKEKQSDLDYICSVNIDMLRR